MTSASPTFLTGRDNPLLKRLRRLSRDNTAYRDAGQVWIEGDHLCSAALARGVLPVLGVFSESFWHLASVKWCSFAIENVVIPDALFGGFSALESSMGLGFVLELPALARPAPAAATVVLDRLQDAGNVGSILRSAAAFGFTQVLAMKGTAALWSPKVLRAGMGAHFALRLLEGLEPEALDALTVPLVQTSSHEGPFLHEQPPPFPCAWIMGHEGQGVGAGLAARAKYSARIAQPGGEESLNVAAAAAICLQASAITAMQSGGVLRP